MSIRIGIGLDVFGAGIDADAQTIYNRIIVDGGVSNLTRLNFFVKGLKTIYGDLANVPVCYDAHWIGYKLGSGTGATAGQAAAKLYSLTVAGDAVQATAASQPLLLAHNGVNYYQGVGIIGNYIQTNTTYTFDSLVNITEFTLNNDSLNEQSIFTYGAYGSNIAFGLTFRKAIDQFNILYYAPTAITASFFYTLSVGVKYSIRTTRNSVSGLLSVELLISGVWTTIYSAIGTSGALSNKANFHIGARSTSNPTNAKIFRSQTYDLSNNLLIDFNPNQYNAATSQTAWTSATGEVWTINTGTATTGYKGVLVDRTIVQGDGVDDVIGKNSAFTSTKNLSVYSAKRSYNVTDSDGYVTSGVNPGDMTQSDINFSITGNLFSPTGRSVMLQFAALRQSSTNNSKVRYNANADTSGTPTTTACSRIILFGSPYAWDFGTAQYSNNILNTVVLATSYDDDSVSTATYNLIRSLNNNAF